MNEWMNEWIFIEVFMRGESPVDLKLTYEAIHKVWPVKLRCKLNSLPDSEINLVECISSIVSQFLIFTHVATTD